MWGTACSLGSFVAEPPLPRFANDFAARSRAALLRVTVRNARGIGARELWVARPSLEIVTACPSAA
jgi:hypothetical protein